MKSAFFKKFSLCLLVLLFSTTVVIAQQVCNEKKINDKSPLIDNGNGTVTDKSTGLMWKQCSEGTTAGANCTAPHIQFTWDRALLRSPDVNLDGFAGYKDWRLPNKKELESIIEKTCVWPAIDQTMFPNTLGSYWTSSPSGDYASQAWRVSFDYGVGGWDYKSNTGYIRLVRSGQ